MLFNSYPFLFVFLPIALLGYFALGARGASRSAGLWLTAASLFFYGWWNPRYLVLIGGSVLGNYWLGTLIASAGEAERPGQARGFLTVGVAANLLLLGYYKYAGFLAANVHAIFGVQWEIGTVALPLAISFFTFTQIAYLVDAYRGLTKEYDLLYYALFVTFFPHLIAGPIVLYRSLMPQFARRETFRFNADNFAGGATLFIFGLAKKVVVADGLSPAANLVFGSLSQGASPGTAAAWCGALAYSLQLYFDFSGYSDMAIGLGRMFNVRFPLNFNSPYKARDIIDFWRRWHITLSAFLRDHLYIPLGGNRHGAIRRYLNLFITMVLGGLWHGAGWTFVIWGALHGAYLAVNHAWLHVSKDRPWAQTRLAGTAGRCVTLLAVLVGWVFFRAASAGDALRMLHRMATWHPGELQMKSNELLLLAIAGAIALLAPNTQELFQQALPAKETAAEPAPLWRLTPLSAAAASLLFVTAILHLSRVSEFLYFQF